MKTSSSLTLLAASFVWLSAQAASADSVITFAEDPKAFSTSLQRASVFDFNDLTPGLHKNVAWGNVGTFDQIFVLKPNQYGGAPDAANPRGTNYSVQGVGSPVKQTTLTLNTPSSYFGMWWSAGDRANELTFYNGNELIAQFTTRNLMELLPRSYYGNPIDRRMNSGEPYGFINFFGDSKTKWDRIIFSNVTSSGFEADNITIRENQWSGTQDGALPGIPVAVVDGGQVTKVTKLSGKWLAAAPGAPAPPLALLVAFGVVVAVRARKHLKKA